MPLDKDRLGAALWARVKSLESYSPGIGPAEDARGLAQWKGIADEIIKEFKDNAVVPVNVASVTAVQPGGGTSGPGTGTGTIT